MTEYEMSPYDVFKGESPLAAMIRLANDRPQPTRKGDKRPMWEIEAQKEGIARNRKARQLAATERTNAAARKRNHTARPPGQDIQSRMLQAMAPGSWYGRGDLVRMIGAERYARGKVNDMVRRGWIEVTQNAAHSGRTLNPQEIMGGAEPEPERLYRLTTTGLARRAEIEALQACIAPPGS